MDQHHLTPHHIASARAMAIKRATAAVLATAAVAGSVGVPAASARVPEPDRGNGGIAVRGLDDMHLAALQAAASDRAVPSSQPSASSGDGIDWADVGIGAGLSAALLLSAAGVAAVRRPARMRVH